VTAGAARGWPSNRELTFVDSVDVRCGEPTERVRTRYRVVNPWSTRLPITALATALGVFFCDAADGADRERSAVLGVHSIRLPKEVRHSIDMSLVRGELEVPGGPNEPEGISEARRLNDLALKYQHEGGYGDAEPLYRRSLTMLEAKLGTHHPAVAASLGNLAALYQEEGRYGEAERLCRRSVDILEKALGPDHLAVAVGLHNLALLYEREGRDRDAEGLYQRSLGILEKTLSPEHFGIASILNNLARLYSRDGRYADAEPLYRRSLSMLEKVLGPEHPAVAESLNNLADLYQAQGRPAEADPLYRRSEAIRRIAHGSGKACNDCR
jgi:tetratricopeptide (TPR) repeat protein